MYQWCGFKSRRGKNKNLTALKSNSNTVWFNFQTYIIFSINLVSFKVTLRSSGTDILYGCHLLLDVCIIYIYIYINIWKCSQRMNLRDVGSETLTLCKQTKMINKRLKCSTRGWWIFRTCQQYPSVYKIHTRSVENQNVLPWYYYHGQGG